MSLNSRGLDKYADDSVTPLLGKESDSDFPIEIEGQICNEVNNGNSSPVISDRDVIITEKNAQGSDKTEFNTTKEKKPLPQTECHKSVKMGRKKQNSESSTASDLELAAERIHRKPFFYPSPINSDIISYDSQTTVTDKTDGRSTDGNPEPEDLAVYQRYRYYNRLAPPATDILTIPGHIIPAEFLNPLASFIRPIGGKQKSIITIFSLWNAMMGTSLLSMPWALHQAGFAMGLVIMVVMCAICCYTAYRISVFKNLLPNIGDQAEFSDICKDVLGKWGEWLAIVFSILPLLGGAIVYWVLMTNFFYNTVRFAYEFTPNSGNEPDLDVFCLDNNTNASQINSTDIFYKVWDQNCTVPFFLYVYFFL